MWRTFTLLTTIALAACSDRATSPTVDRVEGVYTLRSVDGAPLPYRTTAPNVVNDLTYGRLSLEPSGRFTLDKWGFQQVGTQTPSSTIEFVSGTWRKEGNTLALSVSDLATFIAATYENGAITYSDNGRTYLWRRE
jgi:hypothetical protein